MAALKAQLALTCPVTEASYVAGIVTLVKLISQLTGCRYYKCEGLTRILRAILRRGSFLRGVEFRHRIIYLWGRPLLLS